MPYLRSMHSSNHPRLPNRILSKLLSPIYTYTHMHKSTHRDPPIIVVCTRAEPKESPPVPGRSRLRRAIDVFLTK